MVYLLGHLQKDLTVPYHGNWWNKSTSILDFNIYQLVSYMVAGCKSFNFGTKDQSTKISSI